MVQSNIVISSLDGSRTNCFATNYLERTEL